MKTKQLANYQQLLFDVIALPVPGYNQNELELKIWRLLSKLPGRSRTIIGYRYGFNEDGLILTRQEIGKRMALSSECVRQLEFRAMRYLYRNLGLFIEEKRQELVKTGMLALNNLHSSVKTHRVPRIKGGGIV